MLILYLKNRHGNLERERHLLEQPVLALCRHSVPVKYTSWNRILLHHAVGLKNVGPVLSWLGVSTMHRDQCHYIHLAEQELVGLYVV